MITLSTSISYLPTESITYAIRPSRELPTDRIPPKTNLPTPLFRHGIAQPIMLHSPRMHLLSSVALCERQTVQFFAPFFSPRFLRFLEFLPSVRPIFCVSESSTTGEYRPYEPPVVYGVQPLHTPLPGRSPRLAASLTPAVIRSGPAAFSDP